MDLFGNIEEQQKQMQAKLNDIVIEERSTNGEITIRMNANKHLVDITIDENWLKEVDAEQLSDFILLTFNEATRSAEVKAEAEMRKQINNMLPGGLGGLFGG